MSFAKLAAVAFRLHKEGCIDKDTLVEMLQECVNGTAIENGYADEHGLPFPESAKELSRAS